MSPPVPASAAHQPQPAAEPTRTEAALRQAALAVSTASGERAYEQLVEALASILEVEIALISVFAGTERTRLRTLAVWVDGHLAKNFEYPLAGTPCEAALGREFSHFERGAHRVFPGDGMLAQFAIEGYAAATLDDARGRAIGVLTAMSRRPLGDRGLAESMLKIFAVRIAAEIERRRSQSSYRAIFESAESVLLVHDYETGAIIDANPLACHTYGYSYAEMLDLPIGSLSSGVHPYTAEEAMRLLRAARQGGPLRFEWQRRNRDGSVHWDEVTLKKVDIDGRPHILAIKREITERKAAEARLRASEEQYRSIFDATTDSLVLRDEAFRIVDVNPAYTALCGRTRDEVLGADVVTVHLAEFTDYARALHRKALAGETVRLETEAMRKNGERFTVEVRGVRMQYLGRPHVLYIGRDITEAKRAQEAGTRLEAQLRQAQKMEAIGQLTGGIAHDFNNILQGIVGNLQLAAERGATAGDERLARHIERARTSAQRAGDLIRQMLTFSRGRSGARKPVSAAALVREGAALLRSTLPSTIAFRLELDDAVPPVLADPVQLGQVLLNLCINARDALPGGGEIALSARGVRGTFGVCASCREKVAGSFVEIAVRDSGVGIASWVKERMFEPFFSTKETGKGSGMGLAMVHGIVHGHGGHLLVESSLGQGANFRLLLPAAGGEVATRAPAARSAAERPRLAGRVLVVDDEPVIREFMAELFEGWGLETVLAADGEEARSAFAADPQGFDLVLTDQTMPRLTGLELARELLRMRPGLPVILCTGYGEDLPPDAVGAAGLRAIASKPVDVAHILSLFRAHLPAV